MKYSILTILMLFSFTARANSFDQFIGKYFVSSKPLIKAVNAKDCNRFLFSGMTGISIQPDVTGYKQSHVVYFLNPSGWSGFPISEYTDRSEFDPFLIFYGKITGTANRASHQEGSNSLNFRHTNLTLQKIDSEYVLNFAEEFVVQGVVTGGCYYQVALARSKSEHLSIKNSGGLGHESETIEETGLNCLDFKQIFRKNRVATQL